MVGKQAAQLAQPAPDVFMDRQSFDNRPMHVAGRAYDQSLAPRDLFAGLAGEELGVLEHGSVDLLEGEARANRPELLEELRPPPVVVGVEVARAARRLQRGATHAPSISTPQGRLPRPCGNRGRGEALPPSCYTP